LKTSPRHKLPVSVRHARWSVKFGQRDRARSCASGPLERWKARGAISAHGVARERVARRSRDELVIFLTLKRPPRGRPLWLCRCHGSQRRDLSGAAPRPLRRPTFADRRLSRLTCADRHSSRPTCAVCVCLIPACKRVVLVRLWWRVSPARPTRSFQTFLAGSAPLRTGSTWDKGLPGPWSVLIRDQLLAARAPAGGGTMSQSHHTLTRRQTAGGIGCVAGTRLFSARTDAALVGRLFFCARARPAIPQTPFSHPPRQPLPPTRPAHPSLRLEPLS